MFNLLRSETLNNLKLENQLKIVKGSLLLRIECIDVFYYCKHLELFSQYGGNCNSQCKVEVMLYDI
jgi:hypothetical protein